MKLKFYFIAFFALIFCSNDALAQGRIPSKGYSHHTNLRSAWSFGLSTGTSLFNTDAVKLGSGHQPIYNFTGGINIDYQFNNRWSVAGHFNFFNQNFDGGTYPDSLAFHSRNVEYYVAFKRKLLTNVNALKATHYWDLHIFAGVGNVFFNHFDGDKRAEKSHGYIIGAPTDDGSYNISAYEYAQLGIILPVGIGFNYYFSDKMGFHSEVGYRFTSTNFLDGIKTNTPRLDQYLQVSVGLTYRPWSNSGTKYLYNQHLNGKKKSHRRNLPKKSKGKRYKSTNKRE
ncbi:hypothetical protein [Persicobacter diffluens]|uniref:Outer membrane protein beta-barrel domain-containing protein n=1 Tax=Persicobacter diffluens TaxID=981 RepID=A0AAN5AK62_9BACT|nr:hypothetical protein PEDI_01300 [Persicobacter diffluens]